MDYLFLPVTRLWNWVTEKGGLPGQIVLGGAVACLILAVVVWFSNRR